MKEGIQMKIIKKEKGLFGIVIVHLTHENNTLKVLMDYDNNGIYELEIYLATKPQKKNKGWVRIDWQVPCVDDYNTIDEMICHCALRTYEKCAELSQKDFERLEKWNNFEKTLDKWFKV